MFLSNIEGSLLHQFCWAAEFVNHSNIHGIIPALVALCHSMQIKGLIQKTAPHSVYHLRSHKLSGWAIHRHVSTVKGSTESSGNQPVLETSQNDDICPRITKQYLSTPDLFSLSPF